MLHWEQLGLHEPKPCTSAYLLPGVSLLQHLPRVNSQPLSPEDSSTARARCVSSFTSPGDRSIELLLGCNLLQCLCVCRLMSRLDMYGLCEVSVHGDGNCQVCQKHLRNTVHCIMHAKNGYAVHFHLGIRMLDNITGVPQTRLNQA